MGHEVKVSHGLTFPIMTHPPRCFLPQLNQPSDEQPMETQSSLTGAETLKLRNNARCPRFIDFAPTYRQFTHLLINATNNY